MCPAADRPRSPFPRNPVLPEPEIRHIEARHCLLWYGNVLIILSKDPPNPAFMRTIIQEMESLKRRYKSGIGTLLIIRSDVRAPDEKARESIRRELSKAPTLAAAQVVEGTGFMGAAMRSFLSMLQLLARLPFPMQVFSEIPSAARWLTQQLAERANVAPDAAALAEVAKQQQARFLAAAHIGS